MFSHIICKPIAGEAGVSGVDVMRMKDVIISVTGVQQGVNGPDAMELITAGFSGAGAVSDGRLALSYEVGGDLPTLVGEKLAQETINYADSIYLEFGADTHIEGVSDPDKVKDIRRRAIQAGLKLVDCPSRHMGTEKARNI